MPTVNLPIVPGQIPAGFCFDGNFQTLLNIFSANQTAVATTQAGSSFNQWVFSASKPADNTVGWFRLDALGRPVRPYLFAQGAWLSLHPTQPGLTQWWFDTVPDLNTFDGGDANAISAITGNMWQLAKDKNGNVIAAKFPIVAGTLPSSTVLNVGDTGGSENVTLDLTNIPAHTHHMTFNKEPQSGAATQCLTAANPPAAPLVTFETSSAGGGSGGDAMPHSNLPLYVVGVLLQRSARLFYSVT